MNDGLRDVVDHSVSGCMVYMAKDAETTWETLQLDKWPVTPAHPHTPCLARHADPDNAHPAQ
jgi:hypothetical protein